MNSQFDTIWFDLDGTLIHTADDLVDAVNATLIQHQYPKGSHQSIVERINEGAIGMLAGGLGADKNDERLAILLQDFPHHYLQDICVKSTWFAGMETIIKHLEDDDIPWGIITNKAERYAIPLIEQLELTQRVSALVCGDTTSESKPSPKPLLYACEKTNVDPKRCMFIGDSVKDIQAGRACGMTTVAAAYGYLDVGGDARDWQADFIVHAPLDLQAIIWSDDD